MINLAEISADPPKGTDKGDIKDLTDKYCERIGDLNEILRAQKKHSLLIIFQGMDCSGKDGAAKQVFKDCTPFNLSVYAFKKPTEIEFSHDFLWRVHQQAPSKGDIKIFNRSHYEDILIQRVHKWIDEDREGEYLEFKIYQSPVTSETILEVTDFCDEDEVNEQKALWESQIKVLKKETGSGH